MQNLDYLCIISDGSNPKSTQEGSKCRQVPTSEISTYSSWGWEKCIEQSEQQPRNQPRGQRDRMRSRTCRDTHKGKCSFTTDWRKDIAVVQDLNHWRDGYGRQQH